MNRDEAMKWAVNNLPFWPDKTKPMAPDTKPHGWTWKLALRNVSTEFQGWYLVNLETGESICNTEYTSAKERPARKSFSEMMEWAKGGCIS